MRYIDGICFTHFPIHPASVGRYSAVVHGHIHEGPNIAPVLNTDPRTQEVRVTPYINLTVEHTNYTPWSLEEVKAEIERLKKEVSSGNNKE